MLRELKELVNRLASDETYLIEAEIEALNRVQSLGDLKQSSLPIHLKYDAAIALGASDIEALVITGEADPSSLTKIELTYVDGEYLSGYTLFGEEANLMKKIGLARHIDGWGVYVSDDVVRALGNEFLYYKAVELARPAMEAKKAEEESERIARDNAAAEAARTGKDVELDSWTEDCNDPREECSTDIVSVYVTPAGELKKVRSHTW